MQIATAFKWAVERHPDRTAVGGTAPMTYSEWDRATDDLGARLRTFFRGDQRAVASVLTGGEALASTHLGCLKAGMISVPLSIRYSPEELAYCLDDCDPCVVVVDRRTEALVRSATPWLKRGLPAVIAVEELRVSSSGGAGRALVAPPPASDSTSTVLYTAGTTGRPKGVPRSHRAELAAAVAHLVQTGQPPGAVSLGAMPLFHTMGLRSLLASILAGGTWVPLATFDAEECIELICGFGIDTLYLVPTSYWALLRTGRLHEATQLKRIAYAGAPMSSTLVSELVGTVRPLSFVDHYGSTEIYTFTVEQDVARKPGSVGRPGVFSRVRLVSSEPGAGPDDIVARGEVGQVIASLASPEAFTGYLKRPDADARALRDGWYFTGDLAVQDSDGDFWMAGRVDDMINSGGENIYPEEIENALAACPYLDSVVVAGTAHAKWGSAVTAFIVAGNETYEEGRLTTIRRWVEEESGLPSLKRPKRYIAIREAPTSAVGKILRKRLAEGDYVSLADSEGGRLG